MNKAYVTDGDVGCGAPGSLLWHKTSVAELSHDERLEYLREVFPTLSMDDSLDFVVFLIQEAIQDAASEVLNNGDKGS